MDFDNPDIVIGIFSTRFGTQVADADSGTEYAIKRVISLWEKQRRPEIMMYFSNAPLPPSQINVEQLQKITTFKINYPACYSTYDNIEDFKSKIKSFVFLCNILFKEFS